MAAAVVFVLVAWMGVAAAGQLRSQLAGLLGTAQQAASMPLGNSVAVVNIIGTIDETTYDLFGNPTSSYDHNAILNLIYDMAASDSNRGLLLYIDSGGGAVYETDEVYQALMDYKARTGRPVYAYAAHTMASGAYYIACAADRIYANRNSTLGSIGVYIQVVNYAGLYEKLGIEGEFVKSGANKAMGNAYDHLNEEQRAIYQGLVDEYYEQFLGVVCESRGYTREQAIPLCDGRVYTTAQSAANGLIDVANCDYSDALTDLMNYCDVDEVYEPDYTYSGILSIFSRLAEAASTSETERLLALAENGNSGRPMYYYAG